MLSILREEIVHYGNAKEEDVTGQLSEKQIAALEKLYNDDDTLATEPLSSFNKTTDRWRTK